MTDTPGLAPWKATLTTGLLAMLALAVLGAAPATASPISDLLDGVGGSLNDVTPTVNALEEALANGTVPVVEVPIQDAYDQAGAILGAAAGQVQEATQACGTPYGPTALLECVAGLVHYLVYGPLVQP